VQNIYYYVGDYASSLRRSFLHIYIIQAQAISQNILVYSYCLISYLYGNLEFQVGVIFSKAKLKVNKDYSVPKEIFKREEKKNETRIALSKVVRNPVYHSIYYIYIRCNNINNPFVSNSILNLIRLTEKQLSGNSIRAKDISGTIIVFPPALLCLLKNIFPRSLSCVRVRSWYVLCTRFERLSSMPRGVFFVSRRRGLHEMRCRQIRVDSSLELLPQLSLRLHVTVQLDELLLLSPGDF